jgi:serine/threonine protein kinase HipA of HipAB toxin-antitoxin module
MRSVRPAARRTFNQTLNLAKLQAVADAIVADALISNIDDHPRNHAIIARDADWKLSPPTMCRRCPSASSVAISQ